MMDTTATHSSENFVVPVAGRAPVGDMKLQPYDRHSPVHKDAFSSLLLEQRFAHGLESDDMVGTAGAKAYARASQREIGNRFNTTFLAGKLSAKDPSVPLGMITTTQMDSDKGPILYLEDIVVTQPARRRGLGRHLMQHLLFEAWERGYIGVGWETGMNNESASILYRKIHPTFVTDHLHPVWCLQADAVHQQKQDPNSNTHLATFGNGTDQYFYGSDSGVTNDLDVIARDHLSNSKSGDPYGTNHTSSTHLGYVANLISRHEKKAAQTFVVSSNTSGFAVVSDGFTTFEAQPKHFLRLRLPKYFGRNHLRDLTELLRVSCHELDIRGKPGDVIIEIDNGMFGRKESDLNATKMSAERERVELAQEAFADAGAIPLMYGSDSMGAFSLIGAPFVEAVNQAVQTSPARTSLSTEGQARLYRALQRYNVA